MTRPKHFEFGRPENTHANAGSVAVWSEVRGLLESFGDRKTKVNVLTTHIMNESRVGGNRVSPEQSRRLAEEVYDRRHELMK